MKWLIQGQEHDLPNQPDGVEIQMDGGQFWVRTANGLNTAASVRVGDKVHISYKGRTFLLEKPSTAAKRKDVASTGEFHAPMPGQVVEVYVTKGQEVTQGQKLLVLEAMKTQQAIAAPFTGTVSELPVQVGDQVNEGDLLVLVSDNA